MGVVTTPANESDIVHLDDVLDKIPLKPRSTVKADKGYKSTNNDSAIKKRGLRNCVLHKVTKNKSLTPREIQFNKLVSKTRYKVERPLALCVAGSELEQQDM